MNFLDLTIVPRSKSTIKYLVAYTETTVLVLNPKCCNTDKVVRWLNHSMQQVYNVELYAVVLIIDLCDQMS